MPRGQLSFFSYFTITNYIIYESSHVIKGYQIMESDRTSICQSNQRDMTIIVRSLYIRSIPPEASITG